MNKNKVLICGTGALATLFAAKLSAIKADVTVLGTWREALDVFNGDGARVEGEQAVPVRALSDLAITPLSTEVLFLVKSWQTETVSRKLSSCLSREGIVLSLQNGLVHESILKQIIGKQRIVIGVTTVGATLVTPGVVRMVGKGMIWIEKHPRVNNVVKLLQTAGFSIALVDSILPHIWGKLIINAAINPLTAILRVKNKEIVADPLANELMKRLIIEATTVANNIGIKLPFSDPIAAAEEVAILTGDNKSSMLMDILRNVPTEIDAINGAIIEIGDKLKVDVSLNRIVANMVRQNTQLSSVELRDAIRKYRP